MSNFTTKPQVPPEKKVIRINDQILEVPGRYRDASTFTISGSGTTSGSSNIYNSDGTLSGNRLVNLNGNDLTFSGGPVFINNFTGTSGQFDNTTFNNNITISGTLTDANDSPGASGQILISNGDSIEWVNDPTSSGSQTIIFIDNVRSISGVSGSILDNLEVIEFPQSPDGVVSFSFPINNQPERDLELKVLYCPKASGSGNFKFDLFYNIISSGENLVIGGFSVSDTITNNITSGDNEELQSMAFIIPSASLSGSPPMIFSGRLKRDTSVIDNYTGEISLIHLYSLIYAEI